MGAYIFLYFALCEVVQEDIFRNNPEIMSSFCYMQKRLVTQCCMSVVTVNVRDAGEGTLEISICGPSGQNISNSVTTLGPGHFLVSYIPLEAGSHRVNITFNGESISGNDAFLSVCLSSYAEICSVFVPYGVRIERVINWRENMRILTF